MKRKVFLVVTVDTEEEGLWGGVYKRSFNPVKNIKGIPKFQEICDRYSVKPSYLSTYSVAKTPWAADILCPIEIENRGEIGGHLHAWNTPPFEEELSRKNSLMCHLPENLLEKKIDTLIHAHEESFKKRPFSFRAGRWGFDLKVANVLNKRNFIVDSSICPFIDYTDEGIPLSKVSLPDYYYLNKKNILSISSEKNNLLEVPATVGFNRKNFNLSFRVINICKKNFFLSKLHIIGLLSKLNIVKIVSLNPELSSLNEMKKCAKVIVNKRDAKILNVFFHSSDLMAGGTPYVSDQDSLHSFLKKIDNFFYFATNEWDVESLTLSQIQQKILYEGI